MFEHRFLRFADGFRIEGTERCPVTVRLRPWFLEVTGDVHDIEPFHLLYSVSDLAHHLSGMLICPWSRLPSGRVGVFAREAWTIAPGLQRELQHLRAMVDPQVLAVHRAMFAMFGSIPRLAQAEAFYRESFLARDVLSYRAAAVALAHLESELWEHFCRSSLESFCEPTLELLAQAMSDWRGLFSPDGKPYRSLNRTLMNLPARPSAELLLHLRDVRLPHPITDPLQLTALLLRSAHPAPNPEVHVNQIEILQHASAEEVGSAVARVAECTERKLIPGSDDDLRFVLGYLGDYPDVHRGRLRGLVEKAVHWHHDVPRRARHAPARREPGGASTMPEGRGRATALPPVPLPDVPGITFLRTAGEVKDEGDRMGHCIASYVEKAIAGRSFLFHVDHNGEMASVEVGARGAVEQSAGPRNTLNAAARWGRQALASWGVQLRPPPRPKTRKPPDPNQMTFAFLAPARRRV